MDGYLHGYVVVEVFQPLESKQGYKAWHGRRDFKRDVIGTQSMES